MEHKYGKNNTRSSSKASRLVSEKKFLPFGE